MPHVESIPAATLPRLRAIATALAISIALAAGAATVALASQPTPAMMPAPPGFQPKDFTLFRDGDWYHCFYIMTDNSIPSDTGTRFGHSRSRNLWCWEYVGSPFGPDPGGWDNYQVWAPHIIKVDGVFYMFYTGVSNDAAHPWHQRIGVATSTDLTNWTRASAPIMDCTIADWAQCQSGVSGGGQLRDPFVMPDPNTPGRWLLYYGAVTADGMSPGVAASASLGSVPWSDLGPLWVPEPDPSLWWTDQGQVESPHLFKHGDDWLLAFTSNAGSSPITVLANPDPLGAASTWWLVPGRLQGLLNTSMGTDAPSASLWFASEYFKDTDDTEYFACVDGVSDERHVLIYRMGWQPAPGRLFTLATPATLKINSISVQSPSGGASVTEGGTLNITINADNWEGQTVTLEALEKDTGAPDQLLAASDLALPSPVTLTGPSTVASWGSTFIPDDDGTPTRMEIVIRTVESPCQVSNLAYVNQRPPGDHDPYLDGARAGRTPGEPSAPPLATAEPSVLQLRALRDTPLGPGVGLLVEMPEAGNARLDLFDPLGRRIRTLADRPFARGASVELWDGRGEAGNTMVAGVYFARLRTVRGERVVRFYFSPR